MPCENRVRKLSSIFGRINTQWNEDQLRNRLDLTINDRVADWYIHFETCRHAVVEVKCRRKIENALNQLENTIRKLLEKGYPVNIAIIITEGIDPFEKRKYIIVNNVLYEKRGKSKKEVKFRINNRVIPVHVYYIRN
mgnify:CR=1 FL=1